MNRPRPFSSTIRNGLGQTNHARGFFANSPTPVPCSFAECEAVTVLTLFAKTDGTASAPSDVTLNRATRRKSS